MKKIAVISSVLFNWTADDWLIDSFTWEQLSQLPHLSDYDQVIMDLLQQPSKMDWGLLFNEKLTAQSFFDVAANNGRFVILGDPRIKVSWRTPMNAYISNQDFLWWTGFLFRWDTTKGDTVRLASTTDSFHPYISNLKTYSYTLDSVSLNNQTIQQVVTNNRLTNAQASIKQIFLATNRANKCLATHISWLLRHSVNHPAAPNWPIGNQPIPIKDVEVGPLTLLPDIGLGSYESLEIVLRDCLKVPIGKIEPSWATTIIAPRQEIIDAKLADIDSKLASLQSERSILLEEQESARQYLKLLYSQGSDFEVIVRKVLSELGADIEEPSEPNKEDGWITVTTDTGTFEGVLEIKSTEKNTFSEQGNRQLSEWKNRGVMNKGKKYKGIFIGSSTIECFPNDRPDPFSESFKKSSALFEHVLINSTELYRVYELHCKGKLDNQQFWLSVFNTNGVLNTSTLDLEKTSLVVSFAPDAVTTAS